MLPSSVFDGGIDIVTGLNFPITNIDKGMYLVRLQVDGAESPLSTDSAGKYVSPQIEIS